MVLLSACSTSPNDTKSADSLDLTSDSIHSGIQGDTTHVQWSKPDPNLRNADTLFNVLARKEVLEGEFVALTVMTESFLDIRSSGPGRKLLAAFVQTGEGQYSGLREGQTYETIHSVLGVFERKDESYVLVAFADLGNGGDYGLKLYVTEAESMTLAPDRDAVMIHSRSSASGAGDYGFRRDDVSVYILLNNVVTSIIETTLEDYQFSSDEQTSMAEQTITTELSVLETMTKGLHDIRLVTTTVGSSTAEESPKGNEKVKKNVESGEKNDGEVIYKWSGEHYDQVLRN